MGFRVVTAAADTPVSLTEAKAHLRVDTSADDTYITALINSATEWCQKWLRRQLINATLEETFNEWCDPFRLQRSPLVSVTSVSYVDSNGDTQVLASSQYVVKTDVSPGRIHSAYNVTWPIARGQVDAITIRYVAGYGTAGSTVPADIRHAIYLLIGDNYRYREETQQGAALVQIPRGIEHMMGQHAVENVPGFD